jgi:hypothetical protein
MKPVYGECLIIECMFDVFTEEVEVLVKDGIANLYWYKGDLQKAWSRAGVSDILRTRISQEQAEEGHTISKRRQMDRLYDELRSAEFNKRLEISRNFVRTLIEHKNFSPQDPRHRIEIAERAALKLRHLIKEQDEEREKKERLKREVSATINDTYPHRLEAVRASFEAAQKLTPQQKGYALEKIFIDLMRISGIAAEEPFRLVGEQIDGAIKHDGRYYLVELKWHAEPLEPKHIQSLYIKVIGKFEASGIAIAMNGFTSGVVESISKGKEIRVILLDGNHLANVIYGHYTFQDLLNHAVKRASLHGEMYCGHALT